ncbi:MAG: hypothetical protein C4322_01950 [Mastigocladus sp. ERB_26_1]
MQDLSNDESVLFNWQDQTYIAMNDQNKSFDPSTDLILNVTGTETFAKDLVAGILQAKKYI